MTARVVATRPSENDSRCCFSVLVELAELYRTDRARPGSAVDLLDDVGVACRNGPIDEAALVSVIAAATGIDEESIRNRKPDRQPWLEGN